MEKVKVKKIKAFGLETRVWTHKEYGYGCAECCKRDRCDEDCDAVYYRPNCPHCKGKGWIKDEDAEPILESSQPIQGAVTSPEAGSAWVCSKCGAEFNSYAGFQHHIMKTCQQGFEIKEVKASTETPVKAIEFLRNTHIIWKSVSEKDLIEKALKMAFQEGKASTEQDTVERGLPIPSLTINIEGPFPVNDGKVQYVAMIKEMPGMVDVGETEKEAFNQLMISLKVKIAYDNKLKFSESVSSSTNPQREEEKDGPGVR